MLSKIKYFKKSSTLGHKFDYRRSILEIMAAVEHLISSSVYENIEKTKNEYKNAEPYPLGRIENLFDASFLENIKQNLVGHLENKKCFY